MGGGGGEGRVGLGSRGQRARTGWRRCSVVETCPLRVREHSLRPQLQSSFQQIYTDPDKSDRQFEPSTPGSPDHCCYSRSYWRCGMKLCYCRVASNSGFVVLL